MTASSLCNGMLVLAVLILAGFFIREIFKPAQKLFLPSSLIGGLLLLLLGHQVVGIIAVPKNFHELPGMLIDIAVASLAFGVNFNREKISSHLDHSCVTITSYGIQMCLGIGLGWVLSKIWTGLPQGWGVIGAPSFHGSHGIATVVVSAFQKLGVDGSMVVGVVLSTFGPIFAMVVRMAMVNYGIREGWGTYVKEPEKQSSYSYGGTLSQGRRVASGHTATTAISISHLALQISWLLAALFLGRAIFHFLAISYARLRAHET